MLLTPSCWGTSLWPFVLIPTVKTENVGEYLKIKLIKIIFVNCDFIAEETPEANKSLTLSVGVGKLF